MSAGEERVAKLVEALAQVAKEAPELATYAHSLLRQLRAYADHGQPVPPPHFIAAEAWNLEAMAAPEARRLAALLRGTIRYDHQLENDCLYLVVVLGEELGDDVPAVHLLRAALRVGYPPAMLAALEAAFGPVYEAGQRILSRVNELTARGAL